MTTSSPYPVPPQVSLKNTVIAPPTGSSMPRIEEFKRAHRAIFQQLKKFSDKKLSTNTSPDVKSALLFFLDRMQAHGLCLKSEACFNDPELLAKIHDDVDSAKKYIAVLKTLEPRKNDEVVLEAISPAVADAGSPVADAVSLAVATSENVKAAALPTLINAQAAIEVVPPASAAVDKIQDKIDSAKSAARPDIANQLGIQKAELKSNVLAQTAPQIAVKVNSLRGKYLSLIERFADIVAALIGTTSLNIKRNQIRKSKAAVNTSREVAAVRFRMAQESHQRLANISSKVDVQMGQLQAYATRVLKDCQKTAQNAKSSEARIIAQNCCKMVAGVLAEISRVHQFIKQCCGAAHRQADFSVKMPSSAHPSRARAAAKQAAVASVDLEKMLDKSSNVISSNIAQASKTVAQQKALPPAPMPVAKLKVLADRAGVPVNDYVRFAKEAQASGVSVDAYIENKKRAAAKAHAAQRLEAAKAQAAQRALNLARP